MTPEQEAASNELADRLENTILDWMEQRNSKSNILEVFDALMSMFSGRLAFIDSMFEQWCLDKYCPLPPMDD